MHHRFALVCALIVALTPMMGRAQSDASNAVIAIHELTWTSKAKSFGGLSGLEVSQDGRSFEAVSDFGIIYRGSFRRDTSENLQGLEAVTTLNFVPQKGHATKKKRDRDIESMAKFPNGKTALGIEGDHRLLIYDSLDQPPVYKVSLTNLALGGNAGIEAVAVDPAGRLYVSPERSISLIVPFPILALIDKRWVKVGDVQRVFGGRPVGADFGPDGNLYMLSRSFNGFAFATTVYKIAPSPEGLPNLSEPTVLLQSQFGQFDNLEGISAWRDKQGHIRLTLVSDDNKSAIQKTQFVELTLRKDLP